MMRLPARTTGVVISVLALLLSQAAAQQPSQQTEPEDLWPCVQRKVPELSLPQIWNGPEIPEEAKDWREDREVADLVQELAQRRVPMEEAQQRIRDFAETVKPEEHDERLFKLAEGLFEHMNQERSHVMSGIERVAQKQIRLADSIRKENLALDSLTRDPKANPTEVQRQTEAFNFSTRMFQERAQSITYVCEVPTLIEQRLYRLANTIVPLIADKKG